MADLLRVSTRQRAARLTVETLNCDYVWFLGRDPVSVGHQWIHLHRLWANTRAFIASSYSLCVILWSTAELLKWCPCFATSYYGMLGKFNLRQITKKKMQKKRKLQTRWQCMCSILEHLTLIHIYTHTSTWNTRTLSKNVSVSQCRPFPRPFRHEEVLQWHALCSYDPFTETVKIYMTDSWRSKFNCGSTLNLCSVTKTSAIDLRSHAHWSPDWPFCETVNIIKLLRTNGTREFSENLTILSSISNNVIDTDFLSSFSGMYGCWAAY